MRALISATVLTLSFAFLPAAATNAQPIEPAVVAKAKAPVVKAGAWGKLKLGMTHTQAQKTGMVSTEQSGCAPGYQMVKKYRKRGFVVWKGNFPDMKVQQIVITGTKDQTARKIHVGSTLRQLRKAYPKLSKLYSSGQINGQAQSGDDLYVAFIKKAHVGVVGFQFAYGKKPTASSKVDMILIARKRTVYFGC